MNLNQSFIRTANKARLTPQEVRDLFQEKFPHCANLTIARAPGRINLIGDHTDYNDGFVLPVTLDRAVWVAASLSVKQRIELYSVDFKDRVSYPIDSRIDFEPDHWAACVSGVIDQFHLAYQLNSGLKLLIVGDLPLGSGLSSSAASEMAIAIAISQLTDKKIDPLCMIKMGQYVEHHYMGLNSGIMDQFVSRLGRRDHALFLNCGNLSYKNIPLDFAKVSIIYCHCGVPRQLANSAYNDRREDCQKGLNTFKSQNQSIESLVDISIKELYQHKSKLTKAQFRRLRHVITENKRVLDAKQSLVKSDFVQLGALMNESHLSLRDDYNSSIAEVDNLIDFVKDLPGVFGARITGAGFGGCIVAMVQNQRSQSVKMSLYNYLTKTGIKKPFVASLHHNIEAAVVYKDKLT